jgi:hypothetical protein
MIKIEIRRVKPGQEGALRQWLAELSRRQDEVRATFAREGVRHEQAYLVSTAEGPILIYAMEATDEDRAVSTFKESTLPIDQEHRQRMAQVLAGKAHAELLYECVAENSSDRTSS